jgi:hypothetical protein
MKQTSRRSRTTSKFSESLEQRLSLYALAASAAGVGMLALAQAAEAKIVYTPTHHVIGKNGHFNLDLNHDGITDFTLVNSYRSRTTYLSDVLNVNPVVGNGVEGKRNGSISAAYALNRGAQIGPTRPFAGKLMAGRWCSRTSCTVVYRSWGSWVNVTNKYLGFKFQIHGKTHYGWARLSVQNVEGEEVISATLTGYAYETVPNKPIVAGRTKGPDEDSPFGPADPAAFNAPAPEPATLGLLATGWPGLSAWRRKETVGATQ